MARGQISRNNSYYNRRVRFEKNVIFHHASVSIAIQRSPVAAVVLEAFHAIIYDYIKGKIYG